LQAVHPQGQQIIDLAHYQSTNTLPQQPKEVQRDGGGIDRFLWTEKTVNFISTLSELKGVVAVNLATCIVPRINNAG